MTKPTTIWAGKIPGRRRWLGICVFTALCATSAVAQTNFAISNSIASNSIVSAAGNIAPGSALPDAGSSVLRVLGAFVLVTAVFLGGVWVFRNWQRLTLRKGGAPRLNVIEAKSLGQRHAIYVVGYDQQRLLLASSPTGVTLISHLPAADEAPAVAAEPANAAQPARPSFAEAFRQVLSRKA